MILFNAPLMSNKTFSSKPASVRTSTPCLFSRSRLDLEEDLTVFVAATTAELISASCSVKMVPAASFSAWEEVGEREAAVESDQSA